MTKPAKTTKSAKTGENTAAFLLIGTGVVAALIVLALFAGRDSNAAAPAEMTQASFDLSNKPTVGDADAPVQLTIVEDFKCPACKNFDEQVYPQIKNEYIDTGKAKASFVIYPFLSEIAQLPEDDSKYAAQAAECVYKNDGSEAFAQYKSILFRAQGSESTVWATKERLKELAQNVPSIDQASFATCLDSDETAKLVDDNEKEVIENNVTGTPTVFVNGEKVTATYPELKKAIDEALKGE